MLRRDDIDRVYRSHGHVVWRRARAILASEDDARDLVQEVFRRLLENPSMFRGDSALSTFVYAMTTRLCLQRLRNRATRMRLDELHAPPPGALGGDAARATALRDILTHIPHELAEAAVYYYVDEMTHQEIAVVLGCSRRRVGDLLVRFHDEVGRLFTEPVALEEVS